MRAKAIEIHERAMRAAKTYLASERELLEVLREQDAIKGYLDFEATSLYDYAHRILGLPEHTALDLINIARKSREVPELAKAVLSGEITVTKARRIVPVITQENKAEWIELAANSSKREIERAVKTEKPELAVQESARIVARDRIELKCGISEEVYDKLKRVMNLESQRLQANANQELAIMAALDAYLEKHDPLLNAERARDRELKKQAGAASPGMREDRRTTRVRRPARLGPGRVPMPTALEHAVRMRDRDQCAFVREDGSRCECRRWLDIHHIVPVEWGGTNAIENLTTLCRPHHRLVHHRESAEMSRVREFETEYVATSRARSTIPVLRQPSTELHETRHRGARQNRAHGFRSRRHRRRAWGPRFFSLSEALSARDDSREFGDASGRVDSEDA